MAGIEIRAGDTAAFFAAPFAVYGAGSRYVSPLRGDLRQILSTTKNPLFADPDSDLQLFTAHRGGRIAGRITAHLHGASNRLHGLSRGYFGFFDVGDDPEAARALLQAAEGWLRHKGLAEICGNFNLTAMQQIGIVTEGFENAPYTDQIWSPPYLPRLLEENGYQAHFRMTTGEVDLRDLPARRALPDDPDLMLLPVTRATIAARLEDARQILNISFRSNPMFVPVSAAEFHFQARDMKWIIDARLSKVMHFQGKPAAAVIVIPDLNPLLRRIGSRFGISTPWHFLRHRFGNRRAVLIYAGVLPTLQGRGLAPALIAEAAHAAKAAGYTRLGHTWIGDVNAPSLAQMGKIGAKPLHRLHLFGKAL